jgi:hypothetical protein
MMADKRNNHVVIALVLSMTMGAGLLRVLEPPRVKVTNSAPLLAAESGLRIEEIDVDYAPSVADAEQVAQNQPTSPDTVVIVYPDRNPEVRPAGPRVRLIVAGTGERNLSRLQKQHLLGALAGLNELSGRTLVEVRLMPALDGSNLSPQAGDVRALLLRKQFVHETEEGAATVDNSGRPS